MTMEMAMSRLSPRDFELSRIGPRGWRDTGVIALVDHTPFAVEPRGAGVKRNVET